MTRMLTRETPGSKPNPYVVSSDLTFVPPALFVNLLPRPSSSSRLEQITKPRYFHKPSYDSLEASLVSMRAHIIAHEVREVCMPRIGCGLDGLLWPKVAELIQKVFRDVDVAITVYTV